MRVLIILIYPYGVLIFYAGFIDAGMQYAEVGYQTDFD